MFTGIIEEVGKVDVIQTISGGKRIAINAEIILNDIKIGDSICVNGVCLTVVKFQNNSFTVEAVGDTLNKTTFKQVKKDEVVNLERALKLSDRLGGHLVQGHVNAVAKIRSVQKLGDNYRIEITFDEVISKYIVKEGSITVDGISLTVADKLESSFFVSVIPHTWQFTNLKNKYAGDAVNLEVDIIAKYVENFLVNRSGKVVITEDWLNKIGY